ncbi:hypothetical protein HKX48_005559 [Thoreauomyces humboldtii]|nr:hypothetical protein HKX48_005559 [Thoreauomyces humboldtii]
MQSNPGMMPSVPASRVSPAPAQQPLRRGLRVYIMTLGVLAPYRRLHVASELLEEIVEATTRRETDVEELALHVQTTNTQGLAFYQRHGFEKVQLVKDYYIKNKGVVPPDAWALRRRIIR